MKRQVPRDNETYHLFRYHFNVSFILGPIFMYQTLGSSFSEEHFSTYFKCDLRHLWKKKNNRVINRTPFSSQKDLI